jgi:head-tail adaptor
MKARYNERMFDAGQLRHRIGVYSVTVTNTKGERTETPALRTGLSAVPAMVEYESSAEQVRAGRTQSRTSIRVTTRAGYTIEPTDLVLWSGVYWQVVSDPITVDLRGRFVQFSATWTDANG